MNATELKTHKELIAALAGLLDYVGGWDVKDPTHPIVIAREALAVAMGQHRIRVTP